MTARPLGRKVTIKRVAREAGVSAQTVSRVVNGRPDVAPETRQRIQQIIDQLGYEPSRIARSLLSGRSCTLGVVGFGLEYYGPSRTLSGIEKQANEMGYTLLLSLLREPEKNDGEALLREMLAHHVDGIIWAVPEFGSQRDWLVDTAAELSVPVVFLNMHTEPALSIVAVNNRLGGRIATEHLLGQGFHQIGLITGPLDWWEARQRCDGWREALERAGIAAEPSCIVEGDWSPVSGERGLHRLLELAPQIEAVFASNDQMALGVLKAARALGRRVPEEMAIVGFDDIPEAAYFSPPLTTVRQEIFDLGCEAVKQLSRIIDAKEEEVDLPPETRLLEPQLIIRESSIMR